VNFALFSEHADSRMCLFDAKGRSEVQRIELKERTNGCALFSAGGAARSAVWFRVYGPYQPEQGQRFNPNKLLIEPYAKDIVGTPCWSDAHFGYRMAARWPICPLIIVIMASSMPKCRVVDQAFAWEVTRRRHTLERYGDL